MKKKVNDAEEKRGRGAVIAANFKSRGGKDVLARKCEELKEEETRGKGREEAGPMGASVHHLFHKDAARRT